MSDTNVSHSSGDSTENRDLTGRDRGQKAAGGPQVEAAGVDELMNEAAADNALAELKEELDKANERVLRAQAELENYRKRVQRDLNDERRYAALPVMRDVLAVVDNLERAIEAAEQNENSAGLLEGVKMVADQLVSVLEQHQCHRIEAVGANFDPNVHEAIGQEPSDTHAPGTVTRELRVGYQLHDRVVRPSQVFVSSGPNE